MGQAECENLLGKTKGKVHALKNRLNELMENRKRLSLNEVENYKKTFEQAQVSLRKYIKKFNLRGCSEQWGLYVPQEAYTLLEIQIRVHITPVP